MAEQMVYMNDLTDLLGDLRAASGRDADRVTEKVIHMMGDEIALLASSYAPVRTGELAASVHAEHGPMSTRVTADAPYAAYVEFGTWSHNVIAPKQGTYEIRPVRANSLKFTAADGRVVHAKVVHHPGSKAQPFLGPAHDVVLEEALGAVGSAGVQLLVGTT